MLGNTKSFFFTLGNPDSYQINFETPLYANPTIRNHNKVTVDTVVLEPCLHPTKMASEIVKWSIGTQNKLTCVQKYVPRACCIK